MNSGVCESGGHWAMTRMGKERVRTGAGTGIVGRGRCVISA